jgi:parvulin-like peptidyl-prolyl isomerase
LEEAVFALQEGQVSTVIKTGTGYHVVKLMKKFPKEYQPFPEVSERIKLQLEAENVEKLLPEYLHKLKREANIEISLD